MDAEDNNASFEVFQINKNDQMSTSDLEILYDQMCNFTASKRSKIDSNNYDNKELIPNIEKSLSDRSVPEKIKAFNRFQTQNSTRRFLNPMIEPKLNKHNRKVLVPVRNRSRSTSFVILKMF